MEFSISVLDLIYVMNDSDISYISTRSTQCNNNVIMTSNDVIMKSKRRRFDIIMTLSLRRMYAGILVIKLPRVVASRVFGAMPLREPMKTWCQLNSGEQLKMGGFVQERRNSSALAMKLRLSCTNHSKYSLQNCGNSVNASVC